MLKLALAWLILGIVFSAKLLGQPISRYEYSTQKMGTEFRIIFYAENKQQAEKASTAAFLKIDELNRIFSVFEESSEINNLSNSAGSGYAFEVSDAMWEVLTTSVEISKKSNGAFDITVGSLSKLWRNAIRRNLFPAQSKLEQVRSLVNYKNICFDSTHQTVTLIKKGIRLDAGGIAKGYTVDQVFLTLNQFGIYSALIDGGGDVYVGFDPPDQSTWNLIDVEKNEAFAKASWNESKKSNFAVASSGDTYKFLEFEGKRYSHIVDPRTGLGVSDRPVCNVVAPTCMLADALASTVSVLKAEERQDFISKFENCFLFELK